MKKILSLVLVVMMIFSLGRNSVFAKESDVSELQQLIDTGKAITDPKSAQAFVWVNNVLNFIEKHKDSFVYEDIKRECNSAKSYSSISTANKQNMIIGYLEYLMDEFLEVEDKEISELIDEANLLNTDKAPEAYIWLSEVLKTVNKVEGYSVSKDIIDCVDSAKSFSSISTANNFNKILGYLIFLNDKISSSSEVIKMSKIDTLIDYGNTTNDWKGCYSYKWLMEVIDFNNIYRGTSVYNDLKEHCESAQSFSSISTANLNNLILADLLLIKEELTKSVLFSGIEIETPPNKTTYNDGDLFNPQGMSVNAIYTCVYNDDSTSDMKKIITNYNVDTSTPLTLDDEEWVVSYTEDDVTKTVSIQITVNPIVVSETLKSIEVSKAPNKTVYKEGETFSMFLMRIDATYDQEWSDGTQKYKKKENVSYYVDTKKVLTASDTSVTITVTDGDVSLSMEQGITVETYIISKVLDSIKVVKNPNKLSYKSGEFFDKSGMIINAKYKCEWSNGYVEYIVSDNIKNYSVNTTTPLVVSDKKVTVTFIDGGIKKTVDIPINVVSQYNNEWVEGNWYGDNGSQTYSGKLLWKSNATGWWVEDTDGWYPVNQWQKIDGVWYFFKSDGYMAMNEYYNGYWFNADGSWDDKYFLSWKSNSSGWWVEDISGWWPSSSWLKIDGYWYYFDESGYMVASQYVDGWWIGSDGICR